MLFFKLRTCVEYYIIGGSFKGKGRVDWSEEAVPADADVDDDDAAPTSVKLGKRYSPFTTSTINLLDDRLIPFELIVRLLECICFEDPAYRSFSSAILIFMPGMGEIRQLNDLLTDHSSFGSEAEFRLYPLHSSIASEHQGAVFDIPPSGVRKIVIGKFCTVKWRYNKAQVTLATNIAETGITIPDITCVIDTGRHREMRFVSMTLVKEKISLILFSVQV